MTMPTPTPVAAKMTPQRAAEIIQAAMDAQGISPQVAEESPFNRFREVEQRLQPGVGGAGAAGTDLADAIINQNLGGGDGLDGDQDVTSDQRQQAWQRINAGQYDELDVFLLLDNGDLTTSQAQKFLSALGGATGTTTGGAGGSATSATAIARLGLDRAKFAETEEQNLLANIMDALDIVRGSEAQQFQDISSVGPSLAGGREFFGGFGPEGGFTRLAELQGADVGPISTEGNIMPITPAQTDPRIVQLLDALFGQFAQQGG